MSINKNKKEGKRYKISARTYERIKEERSKVKFNHSEETKQKLRKPKPKGFGKLISKKLKGQKRSKETKRKISEYNRGRQ